MLPVTNGPELGGEPDPVPDHSDADSEAPGLDVIEDESNLDISLKVFYQ